MVMGLLWFFDSLHFLLHGDHSQVDDCMTQVELVFRLLGCFNLSRGFFIFLIFVCKRSTLSKVSFHNITIFRYRNFQLYYILFNINIHVESIANQPTFIPIYIIFSLGKYTRKSLN